MSLSLSSHYTHLRSDDVVKRRFVQSLAPWTPKRGTSGIRSRQADRYHARIDEGELVGCDQSNVKPPGRQSRVHSSIIIISPTPRAPVLHFRQESVGRAEKWTLQAAHVKTLVGGLGSFLLNAAHTDGVRKLLEQHWAGTRVQTANNTVLGTSWPGPEINVTRQAINHQKNYNCRRRHNTSIRWDT